jgi:ATP-binding cassette subfamily F protein 3
VGDLAPLEGGLTWGANVDVSYFDQELSGLDYSSTVIEEVAVAAPRATPGELRNYLARFLFTGDDIYKTVSALSGGEKSRVALAKLIYSRANVLVLDEPTNHLDIPSREALERALTEYSGTIITVSHDRYFLDRIATEILHFEDRTATYHTGSYSDYYAIRHAKSEVTQEAPPKRRQPVRNEKPRSGAATRKRPVQEIEKEIAALEAELSELSNKLSNPTSDWGPERYSDLGLRQNEITSSLNKLYEEWETAAPIE